MLAHHAERAERAAWTDLFRAAGLKTADLAGGTVFVAPAVDHLLFNRAIGVPARALREAVQLLDDHGVRRFVLHVPDDEIHAALALTGLERYHRPWGKLARTRGPVAEAPCEVELGLATRAEAEAVAALLCRGFDVPDAGIPAFAAVVGRPGWEVHVARDGAEVVGVGLSYDAAGGTTLVGGVTAPAHRRLGVQRALMARRLLAAFARGSAWASSETGIAVPGEPNSSWNNMERCGLAQVGLRQHLVRPGTTWGPTARTDTEGPSAPSAPGDDRARGGPR